MTRSEAHADQYATADLRAALALVPEPQQEIIRRVLAHRRNGQTTRITG